MSIDVGFILIATLLTILWRIADGRSERASRQLEQTERRLAETEDLCRNLVRQIHERDMQARARAAVWERAMASLGTWVPEPGARFLVAKEPGLSLLEFDDPKDEIEIEERLQVRISAGAFIDLESEIANYVVRVAMTARGGGLDLYGLTEHYAADPDALGELLESDTFVREMVEKVSRQLKLKWLRIGVGAEA